MHPGRPIAARWPAEVWMGGIEAPCRAATELMSLEQDDGPAIGQESTPRGFNRHDRPENRGRHAEEVGRVGDAPGIQGLPVAGEVRQARLLSTAPGRRRIARQGLLRVRPSWAVAGAPGEPPAGRALDPCLKVLSTFHPRRRKMHGVSGEQWPLYFHDYLVQGFRMAVEGKTSSTSSISAKIVHRLPDPSMSERCWWLSRTPRSGSANLAPSPEGKVAWAKPANPSWLWRMP